MDLTPPSKGDDWLALFPERLPAGDASEWAVLPACGAVVSFAGTVRDHSHGRDGVTALEYEAYTEAAESRLLAIARAARRKWPQIGRIALLHRTGLLALGDVAVVAVVSTPHRAEAFDAARYCIDTLKSTVPIWKRESWDGGSGWSDGAQPLQDVEAAP